MSRGGTGGGEMTAGEAGSEQSGASALGGRGTAGSPSASGGLVDDGGAAGSAPVECASVHYGDVFIQQQSDFETLKDIGEINGSLILTGDISDLSPFHCLHRITGNFQVANTSSLTDLDPLEALTTVGGSVAVGPACNLSAAFICGQNAVLQNLDGLKNLTSAAAVYVLGVCEQPTSCVTNAALERASFDKLEQTAIVDLSDNPVLTEAHFDRLSGVDALTVVRNPDLRTATFTSLTHVDDYFWVGDNPKVPDATGFSALREAPNGLSFVRMNFTSLAGLEQLESVSLLNLEDDNHLTDISALANVTSLETLSITGSRLVSLNGLQGLTTLDTLAISDCPTLEDASGLNNLEELRQLSLTNLDALHSLGGLGPVETIGGVSLVECPELSDLGALGTVTAGEVLELRGLSALTNVDGLAGLTTVANLYVADNAALTNLHGLLALASVTSSLTILDNPTLPTCEAEWLRDHALDSAGSSEISGNDDSGTCAP